MLFSSCFGWCSSFARQVIAGHFAINRTQETSNKNWKQHKESTSFRYDALNFTAIPLCCQINWRMICILAIPHVGALLLFKNSWIISFCLLQTGLMDDRQRQVNGSFWDRSDRDRDRVFWLSDSFTTVCSQLKRALLSAPVHPSFSSIPISSCLPCCFSIIPSTWGPVRIGSIHDSLQPSLNLLLSKSIHCSASASCQSRPIGWPERQLDRQVQSSIYLSFSLCQPADSLPQRRAFGHQLTKVSKKAEITEKSLSPSVTKNMVLLISLDIRVSSPGG